MGTVCAPAFTSIAYRARAGPRALRHGANRSVGTALKQLKLAVICTSTSMAFSAGAKEPTINKVVRRIVMTVRRLALHVPYRLVHFVECNSLAPAHALGRAPAHTQIRIVPLLVQRHNNITQHRHWMKASTRTPAWATDIYRPKFKSPSTSR